MNEMMTLDTHDLPPELMLDPHHPSADEYVKKAQNVQRMIVATSNLLKPSQVAAIKMAYKGASTKDIAAELSVHAQTVGNWLRSENGKKLRALLTYYQSTVDGPNVAQRTNMLWRIAHTNEEDNPKVTISAVAEMNKMDNVTAEKQASLTSTTVNMTINQQLSRTALDD